jgi:hypothetical protein
MNTGATIVGRTLARSGAVNLHNNVFTSPDCAGDATVPDAVPTPTPSPTPTTGGTGGTNGGTGNTGGNGNGNGGSGNGNGNGGSGNGTGGSQVSTVPTGSVDTGYAGSTTDSGAANRILTGGALTIGFGALALVAVRRRRVM